LPLLKAHKHRLTSMSRNPESQRSALKQRLNTLSPEKRALLKHRLNKQRTTGHQTVVDALIANGITTIYSIAGVPIQETLAAAYRSGIRVIGVRHQQAAVLMALAQNYTAGKICAAVIVSAGPAVTNVATGLLVAKDNAWPIVVLGGSRALSSDIKGKFQELDGAELFKSITKWSACIRKSGAIANQINAAFCCAISGRPGPVYLDVPEDVLNGSTECKSVDKTARLRTPAPLPTSDNINRAASLLQNARRPALIIGKGTRWHTDHRALRQLVEQQKFAVISSPMGRGILPDDHPLCFNHGKQQLQASSDVIMILGARLDWAFRYGSQINPDAQVIHVDIDPAETEKNSKVTLNITADSGDFISALMKKLTLLPDEAILDSRSIWHHSLAAEHDRKKAVVEALAASEQLPMSPYRLMRELGTVLPANTILVVDGNISMMAAQNIIPANSAFSRITAGSNGCMGTGIPFGIGAAIESPSRPVVVISGDTGFGMNGMELETATRHNVPVIVIVVNNDGISGGNTQQKFFPAEAERIAMFQPEIHYEKIAEAFGASSIFIDHPEQIPAAIEQALNSGKPTCINVQVTPYEQFISEL
jgi:thiamine pyrophosphate-dependent acetolactate synthase large subunit-like protein